jgi:hypothetical protein
MNDMSDPTVKANYSEGEWPRADGVPRANAERPVIPDKGKNVRHALTNSGFSFLQHSVHISRGARHAVIDVEVSFSYRVEVSPDKYPDVQKVVLDTLTFLQSYPENRAYWEIYA